MTLAELRSDHHLTPERLMRYVAPFTFEEGRTLRTPDEFLRQQKGDCDDFATLAADVLRDRGYTARLVAIRMGAQVHVVCYVVEIRAYLDFNRRKEDAPLAKCDNSLAAIASSVAQSFQTQWLSVSEYTMKQGAPSFLLTEFR